MSDDDLARLGTWELIRRLRRNDSEKMQLMMDHSAMMKDVNKKMQLHLLEIRSLKEVNQKLQTDNQELKDLCCFLDDDREKGRKLAREWQRFGKYTANIMNHEVSNYKKQLTDLSERQEDLNREHERLRKENQELKELCVFLDSERDRQAQPPGERDDGDGCSSSTTQNGEEVPSPSREIPQQMAADVQPATTHPTGHRLNEETLKYIKHLESRINQLELEKKHRSQDMVPELSKAKLPTKYFSTPVTQPEPSMPMYPRGLESSPDRLMSPLRTPSKPEAVDKALKVLEVQDQVEQGHFGDGVNMDEAERAILRDMCNVMWKKLGVEQGTGVITEHESML